MKTGTLKSCIYYAGVALLIIISTYSNAYSQQSWIQVPSPDPSETRNLLRSVSGTSSLDVWTVGEYELIPGEFYNLIMHWNGSGWQIYPGLDLGFNYNILWGVTSITSSDVWACGTYNVPGTSRSQLLHWNGTAWSHTSLPDIPGGSFLFDIDAISSNDIWAVGGQAGSPTDPPYSVHYDGSNWTEIPAANPGSYSNRFYSVDGISLDDVWAVGRKSDSYGDFRPMVQHWDGSNWTNFSLPPSVMAQIGDLENITMISSNDVWAVGSTVMGGIIMIHWNGSEWSAVNNEGSAGGAIAYSGTDIFALGGWISHWNGSAWTVVDSLNQLTLPSLYSSITFSNGDIWSIGNTYDSIFHTLVYRTVSNPLPVTISYYSVRKAGSSAIMNWNTTTEMNVHEFIMERSKNGNQFNSVSHIAAKGSGYNYELIDANPLPGLNYYRLKVVDLDGKVKTFAVKSLRFENKELKLPMVYPNPVVGRVINIWLNGEGESIIYLFDQSGKEVMQKKPGTELTFASISIPGNILSGNYILTVMEETAVRSEKIFIQ